MRCCRLALSEAEVFADENPAYAEALHEHALNESLRIERGEAGIESGDVGARDAVEAKASILSRTEERRGGRARPGEEFSRRRIERQHGRRQGQILGRLDEPGEHRPVTAMDTVEIADRQCDVRIGIGGKTAKNLHQGLLLQNHVF
jgi:hypothetical protein